MQTFINYNRYITHTTSEGPGIRFAIWMQGCIFNCKKCFNQEMIPLINKHVISVEAMCNLIVQAQIEFKIEGVSFFGGEPFLQPGALMQIAAWCRSHQLSVLVFSGFLYETLALNHQAILENIDILVDGPFVVEHLDTKRNLIGSTNQRVFYLSCRYNESDFPKTMTTTDIDINEQGWTTNGSEKI